jgi:hypothetical protein
LGSVFIEKGLVQLLVANLDRASLAALVLEEAEECSSQNGEHDNVAWVLLEYRYT